MLFFSNPKKFYIEYKIMIQFQSISEAEIYFNPNEFLTNICINTDKLE